MKIVTKRNQKKKSDKNLTKGRKKSNNQTTEKNDDRINWEN